MFLIIFKNDNIAGVNAKLFTNKHVDNYSYTKIYLKRFKKKINLLLYK